MKTFKTPKGTELPLRDMKGKDYLDVPYRVQWMREEHMEWGIETQFLTLNETVAIAHATIRDGQGKILAQGTKTETPGGFADFVEKAETGAIGRALALCGYGTQFAQELCEEDRIVDSPKEPKVKGDVGSYVIQMGKKFKGMRLDAVDVYELADFSKWLSNQPDLKGIGLETRNQIELYLKSREVKKA